MAYHTIRAIINLMEWIQTITIIASLVGMMGIVASLLNKRIDDLRQDIDRRFDKIEQDVRELRQDIREIRQLLYKAFEVPHKEEK